MASNKKSWREALKDRPNLKKALIAAAIAGGGIGAALLARRRIAKWAGGAAGVGGSAGAGAFGSAFYERVKEEKNRVRTGISTIKDTGLSLARNLPVETMLLSAADMPINAAEGMVARDIAARTKRISENLGGTIRNIQKASTIAMARPLIRGQEKLLGPRTSGDGSPIDSLASTLDMMPKGLRTTATGIKWGKAMKGLAQLRKTVGSGNLTEEHLNTVLDDAGIPMTTQNRMQLKQMFDQLAVFGTEGMLGSIGKFF